MSLMQGKNIIQFLSRTIGIYFLMCLHVKAISFVMVLVPVCIHCLVLLRPVDGPGWGPKTVAV